MSYTIYQKLKSGMANQGLADADDIDVMEDGQRVTLAEKLSDLTEHVADMAEDVSDAVAVADDIKTAQGKEVGDVAETDIAEGVLIWHGGRLYRVLSLIAAGDRWQDMDVTETSVSEEINAMRDVSTEGVYLTITPASAIPVGGVKARIYNASTDTYLPEVIFTSASNRHLLGQIAYGDVYTIIMPSIDGYTQPADQTFRAGQILRQRTVEYVDASIANVETLTVRATKSNSAAIGAVNAVVRLYDGNGNVTETINVSIEGGVSQNIQIPFGTRYTVTYPEISGFITPQQQVFVAKVNKRSSFGTYIYLLGSDYKWVVYDGTNLSYIEMDADLTEIPNANLFGIAVMTSALVSRDCAYIFTLQGGSVSKARTSYWSKEANVLANSAASEYDGRANSASAYDAILAYEAENDTTITSIFKEAQSISTGFFDNGVEIKPFVMAFNQNIAIESQRTNINNILVRYQKSGAVDYMGQCGCSEQIGTTQHRGMSNQTRSGRNKTGSNIFCLVLPLIAATSTTE